MARRDDVDSKSEPGTFTSFSRDQLLVPGSEDDCADRRGRFHKCPRKVSSQEFFSVSFDICDDQSYEVLPAVRGVTLKDVLGHLLASKGLDILAVSIYQESAHTPLPLTYDLSKLGGCHIRVKAKDGPGSDGCELKSGTCKEKLEVQRKTSGSSRGIKGFLGLSCDDSYGGGGGGGAGNMADVAAPVIVQGAPEGSWKMGKTRSQGKLSGLFSNPFKDKEKMEVLTEFLNRYSQQGIPKLSCKFNLNADLEDDQLFLEDSWLHIVENSESMSPIVTQQQSAIWELLTTEVSYLTKLNVIQDLFSACLCNLQSEKILSEVDVSKLFGNIQELKQVNCTFWKKCLLPMLNHARRNKQPFDPTLMKDSFCKFDQLFQPYTKFFLIQNQCIQYVKEMYQENEQFKTYLAWCESQKECNRQRLSDLLVKPMERLTKYALLLKVIHKRTDGEEKKAILLEMIRSVEAFVSGVNATLRQRHEQDRLAGIINRIDSYEPVDVKDDDIEKVLKQYLELDLTSPMPGCESHHSRQLLMEGDLRLKDAASNKMDVHCFLFTDMLLICKPLARKGDRVKVTRQPYVVDRLEPHEMRDGLVLVYLNEYNVATTVFSLLGNDSKIWLDAIRKAQEQYKELKNSRPDVTLYIRDEYLDFATNGISAARTPRGSGGSSLVHSHSGSVDMIEPSTGIINPTRAASFELSDMRASSASSDEGSNSELLKTRSLTDSRTPHTHHHRHTNPVSPRPERRAFLLKGSSGSSSPNTLSVSYPYVEAGSPTTGKSAPDLSPTSLAIPKPLPSPKALSPKGRSVTHPPPQSPRGLSRDSTLHSTSMSTSSKPPLLKTKNVTGQRLLDCGCERPSDGGEEQLHDADPSCFDFDIPSVILGLSNRSSLESDEESATATDQQANRHHVASQRRYLLCDRRYHTADSIDTSKVRPKEGIQKRLSWHYGQTASAGSSTSSTTASSDRRGHFARGATDRSTSGESSGGATSSQYVAPPTSSPFHERLQLSSSQYNERLQLLASSSAAVPIPPRGPALEGTSPSPSQQSSMQSLSSSPSASSPIEPIKSCIHCNPKMQQTPVLGGSVLSRSRQHSQRGKRTKPETVVAPSTVAGVQQPCSSSNCPPTTVAFPVSGATGSSELLTTVDVGATASVVATPVQITISESALGSTRKVAAGKDISTKSAGYVVVNEAVKLSNYLLSGYNVATSPTSKPDAFHDSHDTK